MSYFIGDLTLTLAGSKHWILSKELIYVSERLDRIIIPKGFKTDGASIPKLFWSIIDHPLNGKHAKAAVLHDYLYYTQRFTRRIADKLFLEAMKADNVSFIRRHIMYYAVKWFGKSAWKSYSN